ncbi:MAG: hypothetical protein AAGI08_01685 [Bacteroidota bacterium]
MPQTSLTEIYVRQRASAGTYKQGVNVLRSGNVLQVEQHRNEVQGRVAGRRATPYRTRIAFDGDEVVYARCDCPDNRNGWCKHLVATALATIEQAKAPENVGSLNELLGALNAEELRQLVLRIAQYSPRVLPIIREHVEDGGAALLRIDDITHAPAPTDPVADDFYDALGSGWADADIRTPLSDRDMSIKLERE